MGFWEEMAGRTVWQTYCYMEETGRTGSFERFPYLEVLVQRGIQKEKEPDKSRRYRTLLARLGRKATAEDAEAAADADGKLVDMLVRLSLTSMLVPEFTAYLNYYTGNAATLSLACEILGAEYPNYAQAVKMLKRLRNVFFIDFTKVPVILANLEGDHALLEYLTGDFGGNPALENFAVQIPKTEKPHSMYVRGKLAKSGAAMLVNTGIVQISGRGGRRFLARHIAAELEKDLLLIGLDKLAAGEEADFRIMQAVHEAFLREGMICIYGIDEKSLKDGWGGAERFFESAVRVFLEAGIDVLLCTDKEIRFAGENVRIARIELAALERSEREKVWQGFIKRYGLAADAALCSVRYCLNANEIARVAERWKECGQEGEEGVSRLCFEELRGSTGNRLGQLIEATVCFSDLAAPPETMNLLEEICFGATQGYRIYEEWGLKEKFPYGRAVSVLLIGPPGTGKTMTAHALAHEIGMPLYQVDLSYIMDKYIGETEKHLEQVFSFAEKSRVVLFFDEADSLFGRRSEVADGKDRYANMEVSYILQRIEQYDGVVVLATNFYNNIDKAFLRRMKYVIRYQPPDEGVRRAIWEKSLPGKLPQENIDIPYLSRQFELTGGMIKNIIQGACITALHEERPLGMSHVLAAVRREYEKMERSMPREFWGEYGYLAVREAGRGKNPD